MEDETITVRIPADLKHAIMTLADSRGMTLTGVVKQGLNDQLAASGRAHILPGLDAKFDTFLTELGGEGFRPEVVLLVVDQGSHRALYRGRIDPNLSRGSLVAIRMRGKSESRILLRRDIAGWTDGVPAVLDEVAAFFIDQGWFPVSSRR